ncbi:carbohydrate sulfotransferase 3-like [Salarias fasciatus]|uniref:carbohydrate sulfotransferase 3-like n=1 Tax=Salarias fasciatus TaxID=181472 RepID=UPI0011768323|nr:carbohydrate sulfotransferase 3-like [Salarias fasciatus]
MAFITFVTLVFIGSEIKMRSRVFDKFPKKQPTNIPLDDSNATEKMAFKRLLSKLGAIFSQDQEEEEQEDLAMNMNGSGHKHILLMATTRSGSSFVGEFFNQHGENMFYLFEPLWHVKRFLLSPAGARNTSVSSVYRDVLQKLFLCDFSGLEKFISPPPQQHVTTDLFSRGSSVSLCDDPVCTPVIKHVYERYHCKNRQCGPLNFTLASESCLSKQYYAIKSVRVIHLDTLKPFVEDPRMDVRIIQLIRDPRAVLVSRMVAFSSLYEKWKAWAQQGQVPEDDAEMKKFNKRCDHLRVSAELGLSQPSWLKHRYMLVRYEDIPCYPMQKAEEMYKFMGIPFSSQAREWILKNTHTTRKVTGLYSTQRNSSEQSEKWRFSIPFILVQVVQELCGPTMKLLGYKFVEDKNTLTNKSISLLEDKVFYWSRDPSLAVNLQNTAGK